MAPTLVLLSVTLAGGGVLTFLPQMVAHGGLVTTALLGLTASAAAGRWAIGSWADRHGAARYTMPLIGVGVLGLALVAWAVGAATDSGGSGGSGDSGGSGVPGITVAALLVGALVLGIAYGALQNVTLVQAFESVPPRRIGAASAVWNVGFDAGTALGSVLVGALAAGAGFPVAVAVLAAILALALPVAWPAARRLHRHGRA